VEDYNSHHIPSRKKTGVRGGVPNDWALRYPRPLELERHVSDVDFTADDWVASYHTARAESGAVSAPRVGQFARDPLLLIDPRLAEIRDEIVDGVRPGCLELWEDIADSLGVERGMVARELYLLDYEITDVVSDVMEERVALSDLVGKPDGWQEVYMMKMEERGLSI